MENTNISKRESQVTNEIKTRDMIIFTPQDIKRFLKTSKINTYRIINNMNNKKLIKRIEKGKYILTEHWNTLDTYEIISEIYSPSYIAFWSALYFHKMTDQVPRKIFMATTKRKKTIKIQGQKIKYITYKKSLFFGYKRYSKTIVSDKEKTIIDCLRHPDYSGGLPHIFNAISKEIDVEKLIDYCIKTKSSTIASRLGYILDKKKLIKNPKKLKKMVKNYTTLNPKKTKINPNSEWKIYINEVLE